MTGINGIIENARFGMSDRVGSRLTGRTGKKSFEESLKSAVEGSEGKKEGKVIDKKLMETCVEMESLFVARMFKEMRKTIHKNEWLHGGFAEEVFEDMLYDERALDLSKNTKLGIANMLYRELSRIG